MKKVIFISALAIAAAVSCTKSDIVDTAVDNAIKFENYVGRDAQTKAEIVSTVETVEVNAWLHAKDPAATEVFQANFMNGQDVDVATGNYSPAKYWPNELQAVSFVGWVPVENVSVTDAILKFTVPTDVTAQTDLLVANPVMNVNGVSPVGLNFKHLLSRIGFQINVSGVAENDEKNTIALTKVELKGSFANYGQVDMTKEEGPATDKRPVIKAATVPADAPEGATATTTGYTLTGDNFSLTNNVLVEGEHENDADSYIMLIPHTNAPTSIVVEYTITTTEAEGKSTVITNTAEFPLQPETVSEATPAFAYEAGKAYKYIFDITMKTITFDVDVTPWDETAATPGTNITPEDDTTGDDTTGDDTTEE